MELLIATTNQGKVTEITSLLSNLNLTIHTLAQPKYHQLPDVAETGHTIAQNACIKALHFGQQALIPTLADDTGLMVTSLQGRPGVHSKRYGPDSTTRNQTLLTELQATSDRSAVFISVCALYLPNPETIHLFTGKISGQITHRPIGDNGFGYDPVFKPDGSAYTYAQMTLDQKNQCSHRNVALKQVRQFIESQI